MIHQINIGQFSNFQTYKKKKKQFLTIHEKERNNLAGINEQSGVFWIFF